MIDPSIGTVPHPVVVVAVVDATVGESFDSAAMVDDVPIHSVAASSVPNRLMRSAG